jgi:hypothetical protein
MSGTIVVACKVSNGLRLSQDVVIRGTHAEGDPSRRPGGYVLTSVPRDLWEMWLRDNHDSAVVVNGLVFAEDDEDAARLRARRQSRTRSGLEAAPLNWGG